jgi:3D (Asp-Asp-Asp) domain-containing protein
VRTLALLGLILPTACATTGSAWMREGNGPGADDSNWDESELPADTSEAGLHPPRAVQPKVLTLGQREPERDPAALEREDDGAPTRIAETGNRRMPRRNKPKGPIDGKVLGTFRNTYYDFPSESDFSGEKVPLHNAHCKAIAQVTRGFYEAVCVQGSGLLASGATVSFNRRDCECAELCPRTQQKICFDALDIGKFPWGRGATGGPITPLLTVAVDTNVIPLGTAIYIPEFDGLPRDPARQSLHDGCFIAQDRGLRVQGEHVDVFTGQHTMTELWNGLVPSNTGVTVVIGSPKCAREPN